MKMNLKTYYDKMLNNLFSYGITEKVGKEVMTTILKTYIFSKKKNDLYIFKNRNKTLANQQAINIRINNKKIKIDPSYPNIVNQFEYAMANGFFQYDEWKYDCLFSVVGNITPSNELCLIDPNKEDIITKFNHFNSGLFLNKLFKSDVPDDVQSYIKKEVIKDYVNVLHGSSKASNRYKSSFFKLKVLCNGEAIFSTNKHDIKIDKHALENSIYMCLTNKTPRTLLSKNDLEYIHKMNPFRYSLPYSVMKILNLNRKINYISICTRPNVINKIYITAGTDKWTMISKAISLNDIQEHMNTTNIDFIHLLTKIIPLVTSELSAKEYIKKESSCDE